MSIWKWLLSGFDNNTGAHDAPDSSAESTVVNPATGLPMLNGDMSGIDAGGSLYGSDSHHSSTGWDAGSSGSGGIHWD